MLLDRPGCVATMSSSRSSRVHSFADRIEGIDSTLPVKEVADRLPSPDRATLVSNLDLLHPTELLKLAEVEERTGMKRSNIYRLIGLGLFPRPIALGGSKWIRAEVDEYILRKKDERDRERGESKFAPRPAVLTGGGIALNGSYSSNQPGSPAALPPSTIRMLGPEIVEALRLLKIDIPELYLDPAAWNVSLAVIKVELSLAQPVKPDSKRKKR
jgi:prophage regulatory protein